MFVEQPRVNWSVKYRSRKRKHIVSVLGRDEGYTIKYNPLPEGVPEGKARRNSGRQRVIFDRISRVES